VARPVGRGGYGGRGSKRWLAARPRPATLADRQTLLDTCAAIYNTQRAHRAHPGHTTPERAYQGRPKADPDGQPSAHLRIRHATIDKFGKLTLRHSSRLHHLGVGITYAHTPVLILVAAHTVTVISKADHHSSAATTSTPPKTTGATNRKTPADGRGICNR
jgi:hypothetical protein